MGVASNLQNGFNNLMNQAGRQIIIRQFNEIIDPIYDDDVVLTISGNTYTSGIVMNLSDSGQDSLLVEQGKLLDNDVKMYTSGNSQFTGSETQCKIIMGSGTDLSTFETYSTIAPSSFKPQVEGINVYNKIYLRRLTTGSLIGE